MTSKKLLFAVAAIAAVFLLAGILSAEPAASAPVQQAPIALATSYAVPLGGDRYALVVATPAGPVLWIVQPVSPTPSPGPDPIPPVPPVPPVPPNPAKPVAVYLILETGDLTPAVAAVKDSQPWRQAADGAGIKWAVSDKDAGAKAWPNVVARAVAGGLPAVVFVDAQGVPSVEKLPATPEAMTDLVKKYGGVK